MSGWRVWFAFEVRPGITRLSTLDLSVHWRGLADACRATDGTVDPTEFERWTDLILDHAHAYGEA